jgi:hypothetical protein
MNSIIWHIRYVMNSIFLLLFNQLYPFKNTNMLLAKDTDILIRDVVLYITAFLNNRNKILFLSTTKILHSLKSKIHYNEEIAGHKI